MITHTDDLSKKLEEFLDETWEYNDLPGLAVGVWCGPDAKAGDFTFIGTKGYSDYEKHVPLREGDIFHCASVSKLFTSTAIMKLVEAGALGLHDKLTDLLPDFRMDDERYRGIELLHMLTHTSGLGDCADYHWDKPRCDDEALSDYVCSDEVTGQPMVWEPGKGFRYSNVAYELLGYIASCMGQFGYIDRFGRTDTLLRGHHFQNLPYACRYDRLDDEDLCAGQKLSRNTSREAPKQVLKQG